MNILQKLQSAIDRRSNDIAMSEAALDNGWFETDEGYALAYGNLKRLRETQTLEKRLYGVFLLTDKYISHLESSWFEND